MILDQIQRRNGIHAESQRPIRAPLASPSPDVVFAGKLDLGTLIHDLDEVARQCDIFYIERQE